MKKAGIILVLLALSITSFASEDKAAIKQIIQEAYVEGIQNAGSLEAIDKGFHPGFELMGIGKDGYTIWETHIYSWRERVRQKKEAPEASEKKQVTCQFEFIDVTGRAAIAKIYLFRNGEKIFTDYLSLYKFDNGWRIVSKIFNRH